MSAFKPGDRVRCVDAGAHNKPAILEGEVYTVDRCREGTAKVEIFLEETPRCGSFYASRFELVGPVESLEPARDPDLDAWPTTEAKRAIQELDAAHAGATTALDSLNEAFLKAAQTVGREAVDQLALMTRLRDDSAREHEKERTKRQALEQEVTKLRAELAEEAESWSGAFF